MLYELGDNNGIYRDGLIKDPRPAEEVSLDYRPPEGAALPEWREKPESEWKSYTSREQDGSLSCMAQAGAKAYETETGVVVSAHPSYRSRDNFPQGGMYAADLGQTFYKVGTTTEALDVSQRQNESQLNRNITVQTPLKIAGYYWPYKKFIDQAASAIDQIAMAIDANKHCILIVHCYKSEWTAVPVVSNKPQSGYDFGHGVCGIDYLIYKGEKAILIEDSTGHFNSLKLPPPLDKKGHRILTESFIKGRIYEAITFVQAPLPPPFKFSQTMRAGMKGGEIKKLQETLNTKFISKLPKLVADGNFGAKTSTTAKEFQAFYKLTADGIVGKNTRVALNLLI